MATRVPFADKVLSDKELPQFRKRRFDARTLAEKKLPASLKNSPGFRPTAAQSQQVAKLSALGLKVNEIAQIIGVEKELVAFFYDYEIKTSGLRTNASVGYVALKMALSGNSPEMTRFWLKTRAKWKETDVVEHEGLDAAADEAKAARQKLLGE